MPARLLQQIIRRTAFATDNESSRYALGGVLLELSAAKIERWRQIADDYEQMQKEISALVDAVTD